MARPRKQVDPERVEEMASFGCTMEEIAAVEKCSVSLLERRFADAVKDGRARLRASLRRTLYEMAIAERKVPAAIFLAKQPEPCGLGYRDIWSVDTGDAAIRISYDDDTAAYGETATASSGATGSPE